MTTTAPAPTDQDQREVLAGRLFEGMLGALELLTVHVGVATGLYEALADGGGTVGELAARCGLDTRHVREWLEQQATTELVDVDDPEAPAHVRRYSLPASHAEVLLDPVSPFHAAPGAAMLVGMGGVMRDLVDSFRTGAGVPFAAYGAEIREGIAAFNRPTIEADLAATWLPATGEVHRTLLSTAAPRILDLGCGMGRTTIELARAYPHAVVRGVDLDAESIAGARAAAAEAGVADRVSFTLADAATFEAPERFDLVTCIEVLHDMADPVPGLRTAHRLLAPGGHVLVVEDRGAEAFTVPGTWEERFLYAASALHCVPAARAEGGVEPHGTVVRPADALGWIEQAGFAHGEVLDVDDPFWRVYLATP